MSIYLDHAASTPVRPEVREAMFAFLTVRELMANPSSVHADGRKSAAALQDCRERVAAMFDCKPEQVVFNSGGSEGDTHALVGTAWLLERPIHLAVSAIEHEAVLEAAGLLSRLGHRVTRLPVNGDGVVNPDTLADDQGLILDTDSGLVVLLGCSHRGLINTLNHVVQLTGKHEIHAILGGLHLGKASGDKLEKIVGQLRGFGLESIVIGHCTGPQAYLALANEYKDRVSINTVGKTFKF